MALALLLSAACGPAAALPRGPRPASGLPAVSAEAEVVAPPPEPEPPPDEPPALPAGRDIAELDGAECLALLEAHEVALEVLEPELAEGVRTPVRLVGPLGGVEVATAARAPHDVLDCRLAVALLAWSGALREAGVARIVHMSVYRPGARVGRTGEPSGHASGLAIDVGTFVLDDGTVLTVDGTWTDRRRGAPPCEPAAEDEPELALLRGAACAAMAEDLFQIVLTPHFDRAHENHVHLELRPGVPWSCHH